MGRGFYPRGCHQRGQSWLILCSPLSVIYFPVSQLGPKTRADSSCPHSPAMPARTGSKTERGYLGFARETVGVFRERPQHKFRGPWLAFIPLT